MLSKFRNAAPPPPQTPNSAHILKLSPLPHTFSSGIPFTLPLLHPTAQN